MHAARHPERTVLNQVLFHSFDRVQAEYESHFEKEHNYFRPIIKEVLERYLDCGNPKCGFAREVFSLLLQENQISQAIKFILPHDRWMGKSEQNCVLGQA